MKQIISYISLLFLLFLLGLSFSGCGELITSTSEPSVNSISDNAVLSKEEMLDQANELDEDDFITTFHRNKLRGEQNYCGKPFVLTGVVGKIESDHIPFYTIKSDYTIGNVQYEIVGLPTEDILNLNCDQTITIVGILETVNTIEYEKLRVTISNCYLVNDRYEYSGTLKFIYRESQDTWEVVLSMEHDTKTIVLSTDTAIPITDVAGLHVIGVSISGTELREGARITVSGKLINNYQLEDIELLSIND